MNRGVPPLFMFPGRFGVKLVSVFLFVCFNVWRNSNGKLLGHEAVQEEGF